MPAATTFALLLASGTAGASHTVDSQQSSDFTAGQPLWLSFIYSATRTTGSGVLVLRAKVRWWNAADTELTATFADVSINATVGDTFNESQHFAPAGAVKCAIRFVATPAASPMQHDLSVKKVRLGRTQVAADISGQITGPALLEAAASSAGVLQGSSPYVTGQFKLFESGNPLTSGVVWTTDAPAGISLTITGSGTGTLNVTGLTVDEVDVTVAADRTGRPTRHFKTKVKKAKAAPPVSGSGGSGTSASQTDSFLSAMSSSPAAISNELAITVGSSASVTLATSLANDPGADGSPGGAWFDRYQWYRWNGSAYVAVGSSFNATAAVETYMGGYTDGEGYYNPPENYSEPGSVSNSQSYASSNGASEKFKLYAWHLGTSTNTTRAMTFTGQISAQG